MVIDEKNIGYLTHFFPLQYGPQTQTLRTVCDPLGEQEIDQDDTQLLITALRELMWEYDGVGLAAPQIGVTKRVIAVSSRKDHKRGTKLIQQTIMINPVITKTSPKMFVSEEGCLSLPNERGSVERHNKVTVSYLDEHGEQQQQTVQGFNAAIVQHEIDHLDGILFIDKLVV